MSELTIQSANLYGRPRPAVFPVFRRPYDRPPAPVIHPAS